MDGRWLLGEFWFRVTCGDADGLSPTYTAPNVNCDEKRYVAAMSTALAGQGWTDTHYIVDQGRSGKQPTGQIEQGHW